ncbi:hypothetical protein Y032_0656g1234 [Ancylostoma ceylanicum]|uniref:Transcription initiation factor IIB n=2 Tax=Ancylostoma ceylanicum TaxID=53326 RepID=A0A016WIL6_9BILA|nr:hypothetical protein Y032_0656g1234 [Ancylostoma ceylanicum]
MIATGPGRGMNRAPNMTSVACPIHPNVHLVEDHRAGDVICPECGLVVGDRLVDVGTEWRSFSNERSGTDPSRVGAPENPLLSGGDLSTSIAVGFGASESDTSLANAQRKSMNNTDRQMTQAMSVIREMSERIHLAKSIQTISPYPRPPRHADSNNVQLKSQK